MKTAIDNRQSEMGHHVGYPTVVINEKAPAAIEQDQLYCPRCRMYFPATKEFWWRNKQYTSGWHECHCKECGRAEKRKKYRESDKGYIEPAGPEFDCFEQECLKDHVRRATGPVLSIDGVIV